MKKIHYSDAVILTSDDAADAVLDYATALAKSGRADSIDVPSVDDDGFGVVVRMLVGPASQMVIEPALDDELEPEAMAFVEDLHRRIASLPR
ncbi:hypothetical protein [Curtobacterium ammoniigenes]|uniref:hypothetical protein n=1 Tax=Curtobacterium ammoniigenes TaxID=395387 RepID=UPI000831432D|nr:hypothetical protein [Curtobacterium ammoniigenes]